MISWNKGSFSVENMIYLGQPTMSGRLSETLLEAVSNMDEYIFLREAVLSRGDTFAIRYTQELLSRTFDENTRIILQFIETHAQIDRIVEACPLTDLEAMRIIAELLQMHFIEVADVTKQDF